MQEVLEMAGFTEVESENIHQLESWRNRYRIRRAEKKFQILLAQRTLSQEVERLSILVEQLQKRSGQKIIPIRNEGDEVYDMHKEVLEREHMHKIVAIDIEHKKISGIGDSVEEAYFNSKLKEPQQGKFYFRRVGSPYVEIL